MSDLLALAERCEQATGPDRELWLLDRAIKAALEGREFVSFEDDLANRRGATPPRYTTSLDAAMTLVPEGFEWRVSWGELPDRTWAGIAGVQGTNTAATTPALALTAAALRALAADDAK